MELNVLGKYPEYLQDFEEIQIIARWQESVFGSVMSSAEGILRELRLSDAVSEKWSETIDTADDALYYIGKLKQFHMIYPVVTIKELEKILSCWMQRGKYTVEYDAESMNVGIKTSHTEYEIEPYKKRIRDVIPCNMTFSIECEVQM